MNKLPDRLFLAAAFLTSLIMHDASRLLPSKTSRGALQADLLQITHKLTVDQSEADLRCLQPLLSAAISEDQEDTFIWEQVYIATAELFPPPPPPPDISSSMLRTPRLHLTDNFPSSSEYRTYLEDALKHDLGRLYVGLPKFHDAYFGSVPGLASASQEFFKQCREGDDPLFGADGWKGWPQSAMPNDVLNWLAGF